MNLRSRFMKIQSIPRRKSKIQSKALT
uniref:Uncharacterized protein n=1 Tax=Rhizophora mucronata TaxID=61149 RepID=A0A2P2PZE6_RHIMU